MHKHHKHLQGIKSQLKESTEEYCGSNLPEGLLLLAFGFPLD